MQHYTELAKEIKNSNPEYKDRDDKELVESYIQRYPEDKDKIDFTEKTNISISTGTIRDYANGLLGFQMPQVAGVYKEATNLPKKIYQAKDLKSFKDIYNKLGQDYTSAREQYKKQQKQFAKEHPYIHNIAEFAGGLTGIGKLGNITTAKSILQTMPRTKALISGATYGGLGGASNTEGKGIDLKNGLLGATIGAPLGFAGYGVAKGIDKALNSKLAETIAHPFKAGFKKIFLSNKKSEQQLKNLLGNAEDNVPVYDTLSKEGNNKVLEGVAKPDFDSSYYNYAQKFQDKFNQLEKNITTEAKNAYSQIGGVNVDGVIPKIDKVINNYAQKTANTYDSKAAKNVIDKVTSIKDYLASKKNLTLEEWQNIRRELFDMAEEIKIDGKPINSALGGRKANEVYNSIRQILLNDLDSNIGDNKVVQEATKKFAKLMKFQDKVEEKYGRNFANDNNIFSKVLQDNSERKGNVKTEFIREAVKDFEKDMPNFSRYLQDLADTGDLVKVSFAVRPTDTKKLDTTIQKATTGNITGASLDIARSIATERNTPINKVQTLAREILKGNVDRNVLNKPYNLARLPIAKRAIEKYFNNPVSTMPSISNTILKGIETVGKKPFITSYLSRFITNKNKEK